MVPNTQKELLWNDALKHFTLPQDVDANLVKSWTLSKMATQFQNWKKKLSRNFIKKNLTPDWDTYPKLKNHWKSFVEYKKSEDHAKKSAQGKKSTSKKEVQPSSWSRWLRGCNSQVVEDGRRPTRPRYRTTDRSKNWYYAHGGRLNPEDGTLEFPPTLRGKALAILKNIEDVKADRLKVDREIDELTLALENSEHPGRCRGYGVVLWKFAFK